MQSLQAYLGTCIARATDTDAHDSLTRLSAAITQRDPDQWDLLKQCLKQGYLVIDVGMVSPMVRNLEQNTRFFKEVYELQYDAAPLATANFNILARLHHIEVLLQFHHHQLQYLTNDVKLHLCSRLSVGIAHDIFDYIGAIGPSRHAATTQILLETLSMRVEIAKGEADSQEAVNALDDLGRWIRHFQDKWWPFTDQGKIQMMHI